jgi:hypothetical protein
MGSGSNGNFFFNKNEVETEVMGSSSLTVVLVIPNVFIITNVIIWKSPSTKMLNNFIM